MRLKPSVAGCVDACHFTLAHAAFKGQSVDQQACETTDPKRSCLAKYDAKLTKLTAQGTCPTCLGSAQQAAVAAQIDSALDGAVGAVYCAGSVPLPS